MKKKTHREATMSDFTSQYRDEIKDGKYTG